MMRPPPPWWGLRINRNRQSNTRNIAASHRNTTGTSTTKVPNTEITNMEIPRVIQREMKRSMKNTGTEMSDVIVGHGHLTARER